MTTPDDGRSYGSAAAGSRTAGLVRVVVADDHRGVRRGVIALIETGGGFVVVGEAVNGQEAVELAGRLRPDLVLLDMSMPVLDGVAATALLAGLADAPVVVLFTAWADRERLGAAMSAGAYGYVLKDASAAELRRTLRDAADSARSRRMSRSGEMPEPGVARRSDTPSSHQLAPIVSLAQRRDVVRRWPTRSAAAAAAFVVLATAGTAAAARWVLPASVQAAARSVGLPTPPTKVDQAWAALAQLDAALRHGDRVAVARAVAVLQRRTALLTPAERARLASAAAAALTAAGQLQMTGAPPAIPAAGAPPIQAGPAAATPTPANAAPGDDHGGRPAASGDSNSSPGGPPGGSSHGNDNPSGGPTPSPGSGLSPGGGSATTVPTTVPGAGGNGSPGGNTSTTDDRGGVGRRGGAGTTTAPPRSSSGGG